MPAAMPCFFDGLPLGIFPPFRGPRGTRRAGGSGRPHRSHRPHRAHRSGHRAAAGTGRGRPGALTAGVTFVAGIAFHRISFLPPKGRNDVVRGFSPPSSLCLILPVAPVFPLFFAWALFPRKKSVAQCPGWWYTKGSLSKNLPKREIGTGYARGSSRGRDARLE
jgi:hypothetical protein